MSQSPLRVAIADDDRSMRELLQKMLTHLGHEVVAVAENGQSLIQQAAMTHPDVIITDTLMPDISGVDAAAIIYKSRPTQVILLSGYCDRDLVLDAEQKHVLMYLVKPVSLPHLEAALARCHELRSFEPGDSLDEDVSSNGELERVSTTAVYGSKMSPPYRPLRRPR